MCHEENVVLINDIHCNCQLIYDMYENIAEIWMIFKK